MNTDIEESSQKSCKLVWLLNALEYNRTSIYYLHLIWGFIDLIPISSEEEMRSLIQQMITDDDMLVTLSPYINQISDLEAASRYLELLTDLIIKYEVKVSKSNIHVLENLCIRLDYILDEFAEQLIYTYQTPTEGPIYDLTEVVKKSYLFKLSCIKLIMQIKIRSPILFESINISELLARTQLFQMIDMLLSNFTRLYTQENLTIKLYSEIYSILSYIKDNERELNTYICRGIAFYAEFIIEFMGFYSYESEVIFKEWYKFINHYKLQSFPRLIERIYDLIMLTFKSKNVSLKDCFDQEVYYEICIDILLHNTKCFYQNIDDRIFDLKSYIDCLRDSGDNWWMKLENSNLLILLSREDINSRSIEDVRMELAYFFIERYFYVSGQVREMVLNWLMNFNRMLIKCYGAYETYKLKIKYFIRCPISPHLEYNTHLKHCIHLHFDSNFKQLYNLVPFLKEEEYKTIFKYLKVEQLKLSVDRNYYTNNGPKLSDLMKYMKQVYNYKFKILHITTEVEEVTRICSGFAQFLILLSERLYNSSDNLVMSQILQTQSLSPYYKIVFISKLFSIDFLVDLSEYDMDLI